MAKEEKPVSETVPATTTHAPVAPVASTAVAKGPRNYLVVMLLAVVMLPTGLARAYRGEQIGWTRFWIYVGATAACFLPIISILAVIALLGLSVWGAVDVFQLYKSRTDADGQALVTTPRDERFAHGFYIYFIVTLILVGVGVLVALVFGAFILNAAINGHGNSSNPFYERPDSSSYYNSQYR